MTALDRRVSEPGVPARITHAPRSHSEDMSMRARRYTISMLVRIACFILMYFVPGWWKVACLAGAALIPTFAVILANASDRRSVVIEEPEPVPHVAGALTDHQVIPGEVVD